MAQLESAEEVREMDSGRWIRLGALFEAALPLSPPARAAYLEETCADDPTLRAAVESLLLHDATDAGTLERHVAQAADAALNDLTGTTVGNYRLLRQIGQGGMGAVWAAERADATYQKIVAIKLMRHGIRNPDLLARFRVERQILATLEHPSIARIMDGGTTDNGIPYVVMEYIEGRPLDEYCDEHRLTTEQRLTVFGKVADAVSYAHRNLIVHRDLKPGNILVTADGTPKLLDFGIAKLLDPGSLPVAETGTATRLLTPEYASPEQVIGAAVTTASDVYSLGVILYWILTGHRPYRLKVRSPGALEQAICEQAPERPSTAVARDRADAGDGGAEEATTAQRIALARSSQPARLRRRLHGDLDNIVLMALRKEPERRYGTVAELAEDVRRHLDGRPVTARPATWRYTLGKFLGRHRVATAASTAVLTALVLLVMFHTERLQDERDRARVAADRAERVSGLLTGIFEEADPFKAQGAELTAKELLLRGSEQIESELADEPEVQAAMLSIMSRSFRRMDKPDLAQPLAARALALRESLHAGDHAEVAEGIVELGWAEKQLFNYEAAQQLHRRGLEMRQRLFGDMHVSTAESYHLLAMAQEDLGDNASAETLYRRALALRRELDDPYVAESLNNLANVLKYQNKDEEVLPLLEASYEAFRQGFGEDYPDTIAARNNIGTMLYRLGRYKQATEIFRDVVAQRRRILGPDHLELAKGLANLGWVLLTQERHAEAEAPAREAVAIFRRSIGEEHDMTLTASSVLADVLIGHGAYEEAEPLVKTIRELTDPAHHEETWLFGRAGEQLVQLYDAWGRPELAEPYRKPESP